MLLLTVSPSGTTSGAMGTSCPLRDVCYVYPPGYGPVEYVLHYARCPIAPSGAMDYIWLSRHLTWIPRPGHQI